MSTNRRTRSRNPAALPSRPPTVQRAAALPPWTKVGAAVLFVGACAYGVLEVHYSTDTWIGLAGGRQILSSSSFPKTDTFSYPFHGQTWFNQNWLSHVFFWLLYDRIGPDAVVIGTWLIGAGLFVFVLLATRLRCGSWLAAAMAAAIVAIATRDWLRVRPATIQFSLFALLWLAFSALLSQGARRRWWAVLLPVPVLVIWTHAHGSLVYGYGLLGVFLACAVLPWLFHRPAAITRPQALVLAGIGVLTAALAVALGPFGLENFTHPLKVVEGDVFRDVGEWIPPFQPGKLPPVGRFWAVCAVAALSPLIVLLLRALGAADRTAAPRMSLQIVLFDSASIAIGLGTALYARRFAPVFYILATPAIVAGVLRLARPISANLKLRVRDGLVLLTWPAAGVAAAFAVYWAHQDLIAKYAPGSEYDLLDRVTRNNTTPHDALSFLQRNKLPAHVMTDWKLGGLVMFYAPCAQVFVDGRAQQLYSAEHVSEYLRLIRATGAEAAQVPRVLEEAGTDAVLLPRWPSTQRLAQALNHNPRWPGVFMSPKATILVRQNSALMEELVRRERAGELWWPESPETDAGRGILWATQLGDQARAAELWRSAVAGKPVLGTELYQPIVEVLLTTGQMNAAVAYLADEKTRLSAANADLSPADRAQLLKALQDCERMLPPAQR